MIKVTDKGQISLPVRIRNSLDIEQGDELLIAQSGDSVVLKKINEDDFSDLVKISESSLKEVWDNKEDDIWDSYLEDES